MSAHDYVPGNDVKFLMWMNVVLEHAGENCTRWGIPHPRDIMGDAPEVFRNKCAAMSNANFGKVDVVAKNAARKKVEKLMRSYVQGFLARNPMVSNPERLQMGITVRTSTVSAVGRPEGLVTASVKYLHAGAMELHIRHVEGSPEDKRANYGVRIAYGVFPFDTPVIHDAGLLRNSEFTRRKKKTFLFGGEDAGKKAMFCLHYENRKGVKGMWGPTVVAVIP